MNLICFSPDFKLQYSTRYHYLFYLLSLNRLKFVGLPDHVFFISYYKLMRIDDTQ